MTDRENYLIAARGGKPERVPVFPNHCNVFMPEFWMFRDPETGTDFCNVKWVKDKVGEMPDPAWRALEEISDWREVVHFPKLSELDWQGMADRFRETADPDKVNIAMLNTHGLFLIPINMMGWEDCLCALYEEPEELGAFVAAIADFLMETLDYIDRYIHPDIIFSGDDFAGGGGPFVSREVFREFYGPHLRRIAERIHQMGALAEFHCCGNCQFLIREMLEMGYDICQLPEPNAALERDKAEFGSRLVMTGGWDRRGPGAAANADEETVRQSVHTAIDTYGAEGGLIFWDGGIIGDSEDTRRKFAWVYDEVEKYGNRVYRA